MYFEEKGRTVRCVPQKKEQRNCFFLNTVRLSSQQPCAAHPTLERGFGNCHDMHGMMDIQIDIPFPLLKN
jgi:hypothetical protein